MAGTGRAFRQGHLASFIKITYIAKTPQFFSLCDPILSVLRKVPILTAGTDDPAKRMAR
jgi:hypothetical protein